MKNYSFAKTFFLLLFIIGLFILAFSTQGSRKYRHYYTDTSKSKMNITILLFGLALVLPYILFIFVERISEISTAKDHEKIDNGRIEHLIKSGQRLEIDLINSIVDIKENDHSNEENELSSTINMFIPINWFRANFTHQSKKLVTIIKLNYKVKNKKYFKEISLPYSKETIIIYFKLQNKTVVYYEKNNPENSIIDLNFIK